MHTLTIQTKPAYPVYIGSDLIRNTGSLVQNLGDFERVCVVTDDNVEKLYLQTVLDSFGEKVQTASIVIPHGEQSKCLASLGKLYDFFAEQKMTRSVVEYPTLVCYHSRCAEVSMLWSCI